MLIHIFIAFVNAAFLEASCAICYSTPDTRLDPCGHVLCQSCGLKIFDRGCPFDYKPIEALIGLNSEDIAEIQRLREEQDRLDAIAIQNQKVGERDLMIAKFQRVWKKQAQLIPMELLERIAQMHCENQEMTFSNRLKQMMNKASGLLLLEKDKQRRKLKEEEARLHAAISNFLEDKMHPLPSLVRYIEDKRKQKQAQEKLREVVRKIASYDSNNRAEYLYKLNDTICKFFNSIRGRKFLQWNIPPYTEDDILTLANLQSEIEATGNGSTYWLHTSHMLFLNAKLTPADHIALTTFYAQNVETPSEQTRIDFFDPQPKIAK